METFIIALLAGVIILLVIDNEYQTEKAYEEGFKKGLSVKAYKMVYEDEAD